MTNKKDSFIFYRSFFEAITDLPNETQLIIYKAISDYALNFKRPKLTGISKTIFTLIYPQLKINNQRYTNGLKGAEHGHKGGRPKPQSNPKDNPKITPKGNPKETPDLTPNKNLNKNLNKNVNNKEKESSVKIPDWINSKDWNQWMRERPKKKGYSNSPRALNKILNAINQFVKDGYSHDQINKSLERSMIAVYPEIYEPKATKQTKASGTNQLLNDFINEK